MTRLLACAALLFLGSWNSAHAETNNCTNITSLPTVISTQGVYCLKQDLSTGISSGNAITINTNNVTIDCNDWKVGGLAGGADTNAYGIYAINRKNITIRNCGVRGFRIGIYMNGNGSAYHFVENNRIDLSTERGVFVWGDGATIRGNRIYDTGGRPNTEVHGITAFGAGAAVLDNTVSGVNANDSYAVGIFSNSNSSYDASFIADNRISDMSITGENNRIYGLYTGHASMIRNNMVTQQQAAASDFTGILCSSSRAIAKDNMVSGFGSPATPVSASCTSSGNTTN